MYSALFLVQLLVLLPLAVSLPVTEPTPDTFIAVVERGTDIHSVARAIKRQNDDPQHPWVGIVKKTHPRIGVLLIHGSHDTCGMLSFVPGIKQCEKDSVVTIAD